MTLLLVTAFARPLAAQAGGLQGRVTDSTGAVVVGALITLDQAGLRTTTDSRGRYSVGGVQAGRRIMQVRSLGYAPESLVVNVVAGQVMTADVLVRRSAYQLPA